MFGVKPRASLPLEALESRYGSDQHGLVWGYRFAPGRAARAIDSAGAAEWLAAKEAPDTFLWLHFSLSNAGAENWMRTHLGLPDSFHEALHESVGSTRLEQEGNSLVAVIHDVLFDF